MEPQAGGRVRRHSAHAGIDHAARISAVALGMLLWTSPVAMMIAEMFATPPLATQNAQKAVAALIDAHR